jgi:hypothetical protein
MHMKYLSHILMAAVASTLTACGGGGGGGGSPPSGVTPPPPVAVNTAPTMSEMTKVSIAQNAVSEPTAFTVGDAESAASALTLTVESSNSELLPSDAITLAGNDESRTLVLAPTDGIAGTATVTLILSDAEGASTRQSFDVDVTSEQRSFPEMVTSAIGNEEDAEGEQIVGFNWVDDPEEDDAAFDQLFIE